MLEVIFKIRPQLERQTYIHAMWLEGSYATGEFRDDSDIDVWLDVDDETFDQAAQVFEQALQALGVLESTEQLAQYSDDPKLSKAKLYLKGKTSDQRIELDIQSHNRQFVFSRQDNTIVILFDKDQTIKWR